MVQYQILALPALKWLTQISLLRRGGANETIGDESSHFFKGDHFAMKLAFLEKKANFHRQWFHWRRHGTNEKSALII